MDIVRAQRKRVRNPEKVYSFREELAKLYRGFKGDVEGLCEKYEVKINHWYSPSTISQPKFIIDSVGFTADELFNEIDLTLIATQTKKGKQKSKR